MTGGSISVAWSDDSRYVAFINARRFQVYDKVTGETVDFGDTVPLVSTSRPVHERADQRMTVDVDELVERRFRGRQVGAPLGHETAQVGDRDPVVADDRAVGIGWQVGLLTHAMRTL